PPPRPPPASRSRCGNWMPRSPGRHRGRPEFSERQKFGLVETWVTLRSAINSGRAEGVSPLSGFLVRGPSLANGRQRSDTLRSPNTSRGAARTCYPKSQRIEPAQNLSGAGLVLAEKAGAAGTEPRAIGLHSTPFRPTPFRRPWAANGPQWAHDHHGF